MRKLFILLALLLVIPLCSAAESTPVLSVDVLNPVVCEATADGGVIDLYCGPTQGFYRHKNQTLDLASPYVFFGQFDCWAMVAQGTPETFGPVGWVESALLETLPEVPELSFDNALYAMVEEDACLTNDPLASASKSAWAVSLLRGEEVLLLAQFGEWLYVQTQIEGVPARVFLPASSVL